MKRLSIKKWAALAVCVCSMAGAAQIKALSVGDAFYLGQIVNGAPASGPNEVSYINFLNDLAAGATSIQIPAGTGEFYDRVSSTVAGPFPDATTTGGQNGLSPVASVNASGYQYILGKYGGNSLVWYNAAGFSSSEVLPGAPPGSDALSHISLYNPTTTQVPDGGTTLVLLGSVLACLGFVRRMVKV